LRTFPLTTENIEDNLLLKNDFHEFFKVQWLHFSGEADKSKSTYFSSSGLDVLEIIQIGFIFDRVIPDIIGWLF